MYYKSLGVTVFAKERIGVRVVSTFSNMPSP